MGSWVRLAGLLVAVVLAVWVLRQFPPILLLASLLLGLVYVNHVLTTKPKRDGTRGTAELLGLRTVSADEVPVAAMPFALLGRPGATVTDVMAGPWRGAGVRLFDLATTTAQPVAGADPTRRFTCATAPLETETPHLVVEPLAFLTPAEERAPLPVVSVPSQRIAAAYDIRCPDPGFATGLVTSIEGWLLAQEETVAAEVVGGAALVYERAVPLRDRDLLLEALEGLLGALPIAGRSTGT